MPANLKKIHHLPHKWIKTLVEGPWKFFGQFIAAIALPLQRSPKPCWRKAGVWMWRSGVPAWTAWMMLSHFVTVMSYCICHWDCQICQCENIVPIESNRRIDRYDSIIYDIIWCVMTCSYMIHNMVQWIAHSFEPGLWTENVALVFRVLIQVAGKAVMVRASVLDRNRLPQSPQPYSNLYAANWIRKTVSLTSGRNSWGINL